MKLAVLADVHANYRALQAVAADLEAWGPDQVIVAGDLVNRGPRPLECLEYVQRKREQDGWLWVRGNHEDYVISRARPGASQDEPEFDVHRPSWWTYQKLNRDVSLLEEMPFQQSLRAPDGNEARIVHASMRHNRDGIYPETSDESLRHKLGPHPHGNSSLSLFVVGHTHRPLVRSLNGTQVVNAGSAGLPFDGDTRPAYARLTYAREAWQAEIVRVDYDLAGALQDFDDSGYAQEAGPLIRLVRIELQHARSMLFNWAARFQDLCTRGELSMEESVSSFLSES